MQIRCLASIRYATKREHDVFTRGISVEKSHFVLGAGNMMPKLYTERDVAFYLHRNYATLLAWLTENPTDQWGQPFFLQVGRNKRFTGDQIVRLIHALLTYDEAQRQRRDFEAIKVTTYNVPLNIHAQWWAR